jgi:hypothetical protein
MDDENAHSHRVCAKLAWSASKDGQVDGAHHQEKDNLAGNGRGKEQGHGGGEQDQGGKRRAHQARRGRDA